MSLLSTEPATTEIYTLSLHDALPICRFKRSSREGRVIGEGQTLEIAGSLGPQERRSAFLTHRMQHESIPSLADRKSTRLNSSHGYISYAVFCLKKKKKLL